jgi:uncharacterized membrane protein
VNTPDDEVHDDSDDSAVVHTGEVVDADLSEEDEAAGLAAYWAGWWYSGPIPLPQVAAGWEEVLPGAADRILGMAEREQ